LLKFWVASEACYRFVQDRKSGAFELMLSTPLSVEEILRGQRLALFRQFGGPVMFVLAVDFLFLILGLADRDMHRSDGRSFWVMLWIVGMFVFVMDLFALSWVSMWGGLSSKQVNRASTSAIAKILVMPWMAFFFSMTLVGVAGVFSKFNPDEHGILLYWFALCILNNLIFMFWSKENLRTRLREMATQRFAPKSKGFWRSKSREEKAEQEVPPVIFTT
jgi:hypothetical protein